MQPQRHFHRFQPHEDATPGREIGPRELSGFVQKTSLLLLLEERIFGVNCII
jgi:hypothetical protein